jgi:hypothetical protein
LPRTVGGRPQHVASPKPDALQAIAAITGHKTLSEIERYAKAAEQERLARDAMARIEG